MRFIKYWLPAITCAILIFYFSSIPGENIPVVFSRHQVFFHIVEYAIFAILLSRALKEYYPGLIYIRRFLWVFFLSFIYAISDEFHQAFVPNRYPCIFDLAYDGIGIFISNIFYR